MSVIWDGTDTEALHLLCPPKKLRPASGRAESTSARAELRALRPGVAKSFTEWLERTLDACPDAPFNYWQMPNFTDLGPAIPDDPNYEPTRKH